MLLSLLTRHPGRQYHHTPRQRALLPSRDGDGPNRPELLPPVPRARNQPLLWRPRRVPRHDFRRRGGVGGGRGRCIPGYSGGYKCGHYAHLETSSLPLPARRLERTFTASELLVAEGGRTTRVYIEPHVQAADSSFLPFSSQIIISHRYFHTPCASPGQ
ncbi:hypothetical protein CONLIGDRAFT_153510 [Coniochaeta ligniaria NRRL 30616]|uniref:Uncharacterized protein n=1 Tax=Coniochaeta ligniaria NRRL 30616 TaxID=1408157 RepID=A0A1J7I5A6_9PEZI|nr:hypothetical protein CONLIGDRAFT_153510 [Coniochaeta ligniaria NRRL 30616]